ncbi:hypothetical protein P5V62_16750 [Mycobacteroides abscessus subsp. massiliense]|uniref:hypothetical protein n=1 Tax=Mycobacteroides abscessus TaxID=36809 RepID=UPI0009A8FBCE|nr:hypothetical protein [Mycobacteroides abscessus]MDO2976028.1 hypothetical protein [Mycobacteroides abscessus subsp. massiliense]SKF18694.1 Uncharacterised protein [Mycobacteroides abscessus subsp. massiliense]SKO40178.1 Uncharacterised protein [Mycobacteroides abscessus subsp. massiliense]SKY72252.1 Uncharacterised protein [Mycobacteroides abscessus subsp. massiliense]
MPPRRRRAHRRDELRTEILTELRECLGSHAEPEGVLHETLVGPLDRGESVQIRRWDIPDWNPARFDGPPDDWLILDEDNTLRDI